MRPGFEFFFEPKNALHRQYEAVRAYVVDERTAEEVAEMFGYTAGSIRVLCHKFRHDQGFREHLFPDEPPRECKRNRLRDLMVGMRKKNLSVYDIQRELRGQEIEVSVDTINTTLREEGFAPLPRRLDEERPESIGPEAAAVADVRQLDMSPRTFHSPLAGLFLFVPLMVDIDLRAVCRRARLPGSNMIPSEQAIRTMLALKLLGKERKSHVMDLVFDQGIALFAGLNVVPKRSYLASYSSSIDRRKTLAFMRAWFKEIGDAGVRAGTSFDLDFHAVPHHGEDEILEKHYVSRRSRSQKGILVFLAQETEDRVMCYANADILKSERGQEVLEFVKFWKKRTGKFPEEVVFDSGLTNYENLSELNEIDIKFITLRRRSKKMLERLKALPQSAWRRTRLDNVARKFRNPKVYEEKVQLKGYVGEIRQMSVKDLGHDEPTVILTNYERRSAAKVIGRYARRMIIENGIADQVGFFHMDALSSVVGLKVDFDLQITLMASALYRLMGKRMDHGFGRAQARQIFRKIVDVSGDVTITDDAVHVELAKRAHNPIIVASGLVDTPTPMPWLRGRHLVIHTR